MKRKGEAPRTSVHPADSLKPRLVTPPDAKKMVARNGRSRLKAIGCRRRRIDDSATAISAVHQRIAVWGLLSHPRTPPPEPMWGSSIANSFIKVTAENKMNPTFIGSSEFQLQARSSLLLFCPKLS